MLDFIPQPWRDRIESAFVIGFVLAWFGRQVGKAVIRSGSTSRLARFLVEIGPGIRSVQDHVAPHLPPGARAVLDSLTDSEPPPAQAKKGPGWGPPGAMLTLALLVTGCSNLAPATVAANELRAVLHAAAPVLKDRCLAITDASTLPADPYARQLAAQMRLKEYDRSGCPRSVRIYDDGRRAHLAIHATLVAIKAGRCAGKSRLADDCDLQGAVIEASKATIAVAERARQVAGGGL